MITDGANIIGGRFFL
jgi:hypothetical protein